MIFLHLSGGGEGVCKSWSWSVQEVRIVSAMQTSVSGQQQTGGEPPVHEYGLDISAVLLRIISITLKYVPEEIGVELSPQLRATDFSP